MDLICQHIIIVIKDGRKHGRKKTHKKLRLSLPENCVVCITNVAGPVHTDIDHTVNGILHTLTGHIKELLIWALATQIMFSSLWKSTNSVIQYIAYKYFYTCYCSVTCPLWMGLHFWTCALDLPIWCLLCGWLPFMLSHQIAIILVLLCARAGSFCKAVHNELTQWTCC